MGQDDGPLAGPVKVGVDQPAVRGRIRDMLLCADSAGKEQEREQCTRSIHALRITRPVGDRQVLTRIAEGPRVDPAQRQPFVRIASERGEGCFDPAETGFVDRIAVESCCRLPELT